MTSKVEFTKDDFFAAQWEHTTKDGQAYCYDSLLQSLERMSKQKRDENKVAEAEALNLLAIIASMRLKTSSINEPFEPLYIDYQRNQRSLLPLDLTENDLSFLESVLPEVNDSWLRARIADVLWIGRKPRVPKFAHIAIDAYSEHEIEFDTWIFDVKKCYARAIALCRQIKDFDRHSRIQKKLIKEAIKSDSKDFGLIVQVCKLLNDLALDATHEKAIAENLIRISELCRKKEDYILARDCLSIAAIKFTQLKQEGEKTDCLFQFAACFEEEADNIKGSQSFFANLLYSQATQAYRRIPRTRRKPLGVDEKINSLKLKISDTGVASLKDMAVIKTPVEDGRQMVEEAQKHVSEKELARDAVLYFTGVFGGFQRDKLFQDAKINMRSYLFMSLFGSTHLSRDGRVVARVPPASLSSDDESVNAKVVEKNALSIFTSECQIIVQATIIPALDQILKEHVIEKNLIIGACYHSPVVPDNREQILANALWAGFEYEFSNAVHLLCPQVEHIVRTQLNESGVNTRNVDDDGISSELGLGSLLELPQCEKVFGKDTTFELKAVFTHALGFNLRNDVAHGLLDDNSAYEISSIYAWWLVLKLVIRSITDQSSS